MSSVSYCDDLFEQYSDDDEKPENDGETKHISVKQLLKTLKNKCKAAYTWNQLQLNRGVNFDRQKLDYFQSCCSVSDKAKTVSIVVMNSSNVPVELLMTYDYVICQFKFVFPAIVFTIFTNRAQIFNGDCIHFPYPSIFPQHPLNIQFISEWILPKKIFHRSGLPKHGKLKFCLKKLVWLELSLFFDLYECNLVGYELLKERFIHKSPKWQDSFTAHLYSHHGFHFLSIIKRNSVSSISIVVKNLQLAGQEVFLTRTKVKDSIDEYFAP